MRDPLEEIDDLQGQVQRLEDALTAERAHSRKWEKFAKHNRAEAEQWKALLRSSEALVKISRQLAAERE